jgi:hypothetical protein
MGPMRSSPYQVTIVVRWLSEVPNRPGRQIVGKARSRLIPGSDLGRLSTSSISSQLIPQCRTTRSLPAEPTGQIRRNTHSAGGGHANAWVDMHGFQPSRPAPLAKEQASGRGARPCAHMISRRLALRLSGT